MTPSEHAELLARFERCSTATFDPMVLLDGRLELLASSPAAAALGVPSQRSPPGLSFGALCAPGEGEEATRRLAAMAPGGRARFETALRGPDGRAVPVEVSAVALAAGGARGLLLALRARSGQRQEADWFRLAIEESPDAIALSRLEDGVLVAVNDAFIRSQGRSRQEVLGHSALELGLWADPDEREELVERLRRDGEVQGIDVHTRIADGRVLVNSFSARRVSMGGAPHLVSVARDVTAARALEAEHTRLAARFQAQQERLERILELMQEGVWVLDGDGVTLFANARAAEILGAAHESMVGRSHLDFVPAENAAEAIRMRTEVMGGRVLRQEFSHRMPGGRVAHIWSSLSPLREADGRISGSIGVLLDVSDQRRLEEQLRQTQKLESIGRLAGGVAHDFNNILTVILSSADFLQQQLATQAPRALPEVEQILASGWRARDLTRHLLAFARKQVFAPERLDLNAVVRNGEKLLRRVLGEDVGLALELEPAPWPVLCDPGQVDQALMNLVVNARDAMPDGGTLTLGTRNLPVDRGGEDAGEGDQVVLFVRDTGVGMSAEVQAHLFEPFFTTKEPGKGTGLGLATVYGSVAQSGGTVRVQSEPGRGSTVELRYPRADDVEVPARPAPPARPPARAADELLLVAEDDPHVRAVTVRALDSAGYRLLVASSGQEALALLGQHSAPLDLVVTDVIMPGMSGRELVEEVRRRQPGLRALYLSGHSGDALARRGVLDEGIEFLPKPFTPELLLARVRSVLDARR